MEGDSVLDDRGREKFYGSTWIDGFIGVPKDVVVKVLDFATRDHLPTLVAVQKACCSWRHILKNLPVRISVAHSKRFRFVNSALLFVCKTFPSCVSLDLDSCILLTNEARPGIASLSSLSRLRGLNISNCRQITAAGIQVLKSLPNLQYLDMSLLWQVHDLPTDYQCSSLRRLDLYGCSNMNYSAAKRIAQIFPRLVEIDVTKSFSASFVTQTNCTVYDDCNLRTGKTFTLMVRRPRPIILEDEDGKLTVCDVNKLP